MFPPTKRLNYFDHQFLRVDDFADEQAYHLGMRRAHNRLLHTPGVAQGLALTHAGGTLAVSAGVALDGQGREIVLREPVELAVPPGAAAAWVTIAYGERRIEPTTETGAAGDRRWEEEPAVRVDAEPPADPETRLVLGRVTLGGGRVTRVDDGDAPAHRRVAGPAPGAELEVRSLHVQGSAAVGGALAVGQTMSVGETLSVGGAGGGATLNLPGGRAGGDLRIGTGDNRLDVSVATTSTTGGTARLRAEGAAPRLVLGAAGADVLTVQAGGVGVGTNAPEVPLHVIGTRLRLQNADGDKYLDLRTDGDELDLHATGGALFVHTGLAAEPLHLNAFGGNVGVGTGMVPPTARLQVVGGNGNLSATEGDFKVGDDTYRLKVGVTTTGAGAGNVRVRAVGGTGRLMLGAGTRDMLSVTDTAIGFGTTAPTHPFHFVGSQNIALFESADVDTFIRLISKEGMDNRVEFCNRPNGRASIFVSGVGDALYIERDGRTFVPGRLTVGTLEVTGRLSDARVREERVARNFLKFETTKAITEWQALEGMTLELTSPGAPFLLRFHIGGVQVQGVEHGQAEFRLMVGDVAYAYCLEEFHNPGGWEMRGVTLERLLTLPAGPHTVRVDCSVRSPDAKAAAGSVAAVIARLEVCWYLAHRTLMAIEL